MGSSSCSCFFDPETNNTHVFVFLFLVLQRGASATDKRSSIADNNTGRAELDRAKTALGHADAARQELQARLGRAEAVSVYIYTCIYIYRERERESIYIYIYIYIERERERVYIYIYIYIYIFVCVCVCMYWVDPRRAEAVSICIDRCICIRRVNTTHICIYAYITALGHADAARQELQARLGRAEAVSVYMYTYIFIERERERVQIYIYIYIYICVCVCVFVCVCVCVCVLG